MVYVKEFKCSENFPAERGDTWAVREGNKIAERWRVINRSKRSFVVEIVELIAA